MAIDAAHTLTLCQLSQLIRDHAEIAGRDKGREVLVLEIRITEKLYEMIMAWRPGGNDERSH